MSEIKNLQERWDSHSGAEIEAFIKKRLAESGFKLGGFILLDSIDQLPEEPEDANKGWLIDNHLYLYVGTGGDTRDGKYQNCGLIKGEKGDKGDFSGSFNDLSDKPTKLAGYGITDVKIEGNVIWIGSDYIIPLTHFEETDPTVPEWAKAESKPNYTAEEVGTYSATEIDEKMQAINDKQQQTDDNVESLQNGMAARLNTLDSGMEEETQARESMDNQLLNLINAGIRQGDGLEFDVEPKENSANPITSGGVFVLAGQIGELRTEMAEIKGGDITLTGIYHSGYVSNDNVAGTGIGYWASLSGWSSYIFDVTELAGQSIKVTGAYRAQSYCYIFCRDKDSLPASKDKYNEDPTKWTDNIISVNTGRGSSGNNKYTNTSLKVPSIPDDAEHIYLILAQYSDYKASASYTKESAYQKKLTFDNAPTEGSENPVTSRGVKNAITPIENNVADLQERLVDYDGSLDTDKTASSQHVTINDGVAAKLINANSNQSNRGFWNAFTNGRSWIFDVTDEVGKSINITYWKRANSRAYVFVPDVALIPSSDPGAENWPSLYIKLGSKSTSTVYEPQTVTDTVPQPVTAAGDACEKVYLIVSGYWVGAASESNIEPKAVIPANAKIAIPKKTSQLENDAGFVTRSEVETTIFEKEWQQTEKDRIMGHLQKHLGKESFIIGFNTDQHIRQSSRSTYTEPVLRGLKVLKSMSAEMPFSLICLGGDAAGYSTETTQEKVDADVLEVIEAVDSHHCPVIFITGNHDAGQNLNNTTYGDADGYSMFNTAIKRNVVRRQLDGFNNRSTNCWFDDKANKIRFVFTDCFARANGPTGNNSHVHSAMRANWQEALADEKLYNDGGWGVVIFSHCAMSTDFMSSGINNSQWDGYIKPKIDNGLNILACINGHSHLDSQKALDSVLQICSQQAGIQESNTSFDGIAYTHTANTVKETSFDVFVFDIAAKSIHAYKYGAGMDREFYYGHDNPRIKLCKLSGVITTNSGVAAVGTIKATHHNTEYTCTLDSEGRYSFSFLCPERTWTLSIGDYSEDYDAVEGEYVKDIVLA